MKALEIWVALIVIHGFAAAQHFDFAWGLGVKGGVPATDLLTTNRGATATLHQESNYIVGPVAEVRIPFGFALELDGLYRGTNYTVGNAPTGSTSIDSSSWEVPYLAKFRFPIPLLNRSSQEAVPIAHLTVSLRGSRLRIMPLSRLAGLNCESAGLDSQPRHDTYVGARRRQPISRGSSEIRWRSCSGLSLATRSEKRVAKGAEPLLPGLRFTPRGCRSVGTECLRATSSSE
jgi:hypothetical protein